jgi:hypothetical protein
MIIQKALSNEEKGLLKGSLVGTSIVAILFIYFFYYLLTLEALSDRGWAMLFGVSVALIGFIAPAIYKLRSDMTSGSVFEGESVIIKKGSSFSSPYNQYIKLESFGKQNIKIQYADRNKFLIGQKIKYTIAAKSKMLLSYTMLEN